MAPTLTRNRRGRKQLTASSVDISSLVTESGWKMPGYRRPWQREVYRLLRVVGELRSAARLIATAVSRSRLYMADLDEDGEVRGETENMKALRICRRTLGGGDRREPEMYLAAMNLFLVGEMYLWGRTDPGVKSRDAWHTLSINAFTRTAGNLMVDLDGRERQRVLPGDILRRVWIPDPEHRDRADSAPHSNLPLLQELEQLTKYVFTQIDSRLVSAGILPWPNSTAGSSPGEGSVGENIMKRIVDLAATSNDGTGTAAAAVPLIVDVPPEALGKINLVNFTSELSRVAGTLRTEAIARMASNLDIAPEQLLGSGDTNHWTAWYIDAAAVESHVKPILSAICEALNAVWVEPALRRQGLDPDRYRLTYDTSNLTVRPQRLQETLDLYNAGVVSAQAVREAGAYLPGDAPSGKETTERYMREVGLRSPAVLDQPAMLEAMNLDVKVPPPAPVPDGGPPPPPVPETLPGKGQVPGIPDTQGTPPRQQGTTGATVTASSAPSPVLAIADACARRTFELAGGRLLTRANRGQYQEVPRGQMYRHVWVDPDKVDRLVDGSDRMCLDMAREWGIDDPDRFARVISTYCSLAMTNSQEHDVELLGRALTLGGYGA